MSSPMDRPRRRSSWCSAALAAASVAGSAGGGTPRLWTWDAPIGVGAGNEAIREMVRVKIYEGADAMSGAQAADEVCDRIVARGLGAGEVGILLQDFGRGDGRPGNSFESGPALVFHHADGLTNQTVTEWWRTPWMSHGVAETAHWMGEFIARYQARQAADARIPDPSRFHFDTELYPAVCCEAYWVSVFDQMRWNESRWSTEGLYGYVSSTGGPMPLSQLYLESGRPSYETNKPIHTSIPNQGWFRWYFRVSLQATEGAMNEVAYEPIRQAWPGCLSSHYFQSMRTDGTGSPTRQIPDYGAQGATWAKHSWKGSADLQSPVLYGVADSHRLTGESRFAASMRVWRGIIQSCTDSFGGGHGDEIVPWTTLPGQEFTELEMRTVYTMLASKGINEVIIWAPSASGSADNWAMLSRAARQLWGADLVEATVALGTTATGSSDVRDRVRWARGDTLAVTAPSWSDNRTELRLAFATPFRGSRSLKVNVESRMNQVGGKVEVLIRDRAGESRGGGAESWVSLGQQAVGTSGLTFTSFSDPASVGHLAPDGRVEVIVRHIASVGGPVITSSTDGVHLIEVEGGCEGDASGDGAVGFDDITGVLTGWSTNDPGADLDLNGAVDFGDITTVLALWGSSCQ